MICETGRPISKADAAMKPSRFGAFATHPQVQDRLFYTLHHDLLFHLRREVQLHELDPDVYRVERVLSYRVGDHSHTVGCWNCQTIGYHLLREPRTSPQCRDTESPDDLSRLSTGASIVGSE
jgi:hypothetical protein